MYLIRKNKLIYKIFNYIKNFYYFIKFSINFIYSRKRTRPSCLILGTQKGGTTSLSYYLNQNPNTAKAIKKEIGYFNQFSLKNSLWYQTHFPLRSTAHNKFIFDATPDYLVHPLAPQRVFNLYPDMKFIILLRNPIDRSYSHYFHRIRNFREKRGFDEVIHELLQSTPIDPFYEAINKKHDPDGDYQYYFYNYLERGKYVEQLERWFEYFPREQFLILNSEYFYKNTTASLKQICNFVGIEYWIDTELKAKNKGEKESKMNSEIREILANYYNPYNEKLYQLLGVNYRWE
jgi:hypothetical protein